MLSEDELNAIEFFKECITKEHLFEEDFTLYNMKILVNLIAKLQKENEEKDNKVRKIIKRLDNDILRISKSKEINRWDDYRRNRLKAYKTKTKEIKEYIEKQYFEKSIKGEKNNIEK